MCTKKVTNAPAIIGPPKKTRPDWDTQDFHKIFSITILDQIGTLYNQIPDHIEPPLFLVSVLYIM